MCLQKSFLLLLKLLGGVRSVNETEPPSTRRTLPLYLICALNVHTSSFKESNIYKSMVSPIVCNLHMEEFERKVWTLRNTLNFGGSAMWMTHTPS